VEAAVTPAEWVLDGALALLLVGLAWRSLGTDSLFEAVVMFIALGLVLALAWVRLGAPDIALAEAALGAGVTGALFLNALRRLTEKEDAVGRTAGDTGTGVGPGIRIAAAAGSAAIATWLAVVLLRLPDRTVDLPLRVRESLDASGVGNPVTAVLLNFRAYDTLLEVGVLLVVAAALWALDPRETVTGGGAGMVIGPRGGERRGANGADAGSMLGALARLVVPLVVLSAAYLAWAGSRFPGGAFQAGALLGGGGVLLMMAGRMRLVLPPALWVRAGIVSGFAFFLLIGVVALALGSAFLEYPPAAAYSLIVAVEAVLTVSIAIVLIDLFAEVPALSRPAPDPDLEQARGEGEDVR
jgi:multisubunit Na+/H+ antiporter MnhB subunit